MNKKLIIWLLLIGGIFALIFAAKWINRCFQMDACLDKGGRWNNELNEIEEEDYQIGKENLADFYWKCIYDTVRIKSF